jgi:hypothetical protein
MRSISAKQSSLPFRYNIVAPFLRNLFKISDTYELLSAACIFLCEPA